MSEQIKTVEIEKLKLAFVGLGWIGRNRMEALAGSGLARICYLVDCDDKRTCGVDDAVVCSSMNQIDLESVDGIVIATPSAMHAEQALFALNRGCSVFCQKPLARTAGECAMVLDAAKRNNKLLGVDFSYRFLQSVQIAKGMIQQGHIGEIYTVDAVFHNGYGPDKAWFYDKALSGGGCVMDLGVHLIDLVFWMFDFPDLENVASRLYSRGTRYNSDRVEDHALCSLELSNGTSLRMACSWGLSVGQDALIEMTFYGTDGTLSIKNVNGSFYDFTLERYFATRREVLCEPPDPWGSGAIVDWAQRLSAGQGFNPECEQYHKVSVALDKIYGR